MHQILGQSRAVEILQTSLRSGRLHHAMIFHGPPGVGKFTTAVALARLLLCPHTRGDLAGQLTECGSCDSCMRFGNDANEPAHPDVHVIRKELARYSDDRQIRERKLRTIPVSVLQQHLLTPVYRASQMGGAKVFIIDEAHLISERDGQHTLLKTLEEPPDGTYLILVTSHEDRLLATIRSRCQRVGFVRLADSVVDDWLAKQEPELDPARRSKLVRLAAGSLGEAQIAFEYQLERWVDLISSGMNDLASGRYPLSLGASMGESIDAFATAWVKAHANASKESANHQAAQLMFKLTAQEAQSRMRELSSRIDRSDPAAAEAQLEPWLGVMDAVLRAERELHSNVNLKLVTDHLVAMIDQSLRRSHPTRAVRA